MTRVTCIVADECSNKSSNECSIQLRHTEKTFDETKVRVWMLTTENAIWHVMSKRDEYDTVYCNDLKVTDNTETRSKAILLKRRVPH